MRRNLSKQQSKRPWRTPSASSSSSVHAPRSPIYFRDALLKIDSMKQLQQDRRVQNVPKYHCANPKNQLIQIKQQPNKIQNSDPRAKKMGYNYNGKYDIGNKKNQIQSYNSYFPKNGALGDVKAKNYAFRNSNKKIGHYKNELEINTVGKMQKKFHDEVKNYIYQNNKLKLQLKILQEKCNKLEESNHILENSIQLCKIEIETQKAMHSQKNERENQLHQQISKLKKLLQTTTRNIEGNKIKQQVNNEHCCQKKKHMSTSTVSIHEKEKSKSLTRRYLQEQKLCVSCKTQHKTLASMTNSIQNKMLQLAKKDELILSLCSQIQKLKHELGILQKPKSMFKKLVSTLEDANENTIQLKVRELNKKFEAYDNQ